MKPATPGTLEWLVRAPRRRARRTPKIVRVPGPLGIPDASTQPELIVLPATEEAEPRIELP